jgi:hypothetical protein
MPLSVLDTAELFPSGPTCKKMMDLTNAKTFKSSAFEPSEEELKEGLRTRRRQRTRDSSSPSPSPSPRKVINLVDSDDELPDMSQLLAERGKNSGRHSQPRFEEEEGSSDEEQDSQHGSQRRLKPPGPRDVSIISPTFRVFLILTQTQDDIIDLTEDNIPSGSSDMMMNSPAGSSRQNSTPQRKKSYWDPRPSKQTSPAKGKGKQRADGNQGPSDAVIATWRKGDEDLEPSTKMMALIDLLQEWDESGDKTIVYSQCQLKDQLIFHFPTDTILT